MCLLGADGTTLDPEVEEVEVEVAVSSPNSAFFSLPAVG